MATKRNRPQPGIDTSYDGVDISGPDLSPKHDAVLDALLAGWSQKKAAEAGHVSEFTVCRWVKGHDAFRAEYVRRRRAVAAGQDELLRDLRSIALLQLRDLLTFGNTAHRLKAIEIVLSATADLPPLADDTEYVPQPLPVDPVFGY